MTLRNASGKFTLPSFGRNKNQAHHDSTPGQSRVSSSTYNSGPAPTMTSGDSEPSSPRVPESMMSGSTGGGGGLGMGGGGGGGGGGGPSAFDGIGRKLGKSIAHTSLLPSLGNQDLRALQDVITAEKAMMGTCDRLATETGTAAIKLPLYGQAEGPDLQDVLSHSSTLLNQLSAAFRAFASHEASMRMCFKKIRARDEKLEEMRRRRRATGQKAEAAERKLAKMGPENKQLPAQTDLLERLRQEMRQMDADIVSEETKLGDFKRQTVKEAMSYKFGGLEELGEKMCIIGELGKLLLEEIPLEETPPGYDRAPYNAYERTENTTKEAIKCLATVQFHAASAAPKPPGLPAMMDSGSLRAPSIPRHDSIPRPGGLYTVADHEEYGDYPAERKSSGVRDSLPPQLPAIGESFGGAPSRPERAAARTTFGDFGPAHQGANSATPAGNMVWKGGDSDQDHGLASHDYEYRQQQEMDAARGREAAGSAPSAVPSSDLNVTPTAPVTTIEEADNESEGHETELAHDNDVHHAGSHNAQAHNAGWQPMKAETAAGGNGNRGLSLHDGPGYTLPSLGGHEPFSHQFLSTGEGNRDVRPGSNNSAYYSAGDAAASPPRLPGVRQSEDGEFSTPLSSPPPPHLSAPQAYDGIAHPDEDTSPGLAYTAEVPDATSPPRREYDYADEPAVVNIPAERPLARYIPAVPPPAPSDLDDYDHPASVRESYTSHYPQDPRDSFAPSFATRDSFRDSTMPADAFNVRDSFARTSNGSIHGSSVQEASLVSIPSTTTSFTINPPASASGVMSAAAFRRGAKPRMSGTGSSDSFGSDPIPPNSPPGPSGLAGPRRLPVPPTQVPGVPRSPSPRDSSDERRSPPPGYDNELR